MRANAPQHRRLGRERPDRPAKLEGLVVVELDPLVVLPVVDADVEVAVVRRQVVVEREARIRRRHRREQRQALGERRALETIAVDPFIEVHPWRLLDADSRPRSLRHPVVEVELGIGVLDAIDQAVVGDARPGGQREQCALARDVGGDAKREQMRNLPRDVDVGSRHVERASVDGVAVGVRGGWSRLVGVERKQRHAHANRRRVVRRRISRSWSHLRGGGRGERSAARRQQRGASVSWSPPYPNGSGGLLRGRYIRVKSVLLHAVSSAESECRIDIGIGDFAAGAAERAAHEAAVRRAPQEPDLFQGSDRRLAQLFGQVAQPADLRAASA